MHFEDGMRFVRDCEDEYDLILVDSTDPFGPGEGLFTREFYGHCYKALHENGILVNQNESPFYPDDALAMQRAHQRIAATFPIVPPLPDARSVLPLRSLDVRFCLERAAPRPRYPRGRMDGAWPHDEILQP